MSKRNSFSRNLVLLTSSAFALSLCLGHFGSAEDANASSRARGRRGKPNVRTSRSVSAIAKRPKTRRNVTRASLRPKPKGPQRSNVRRAKAKRAVTSSAAAKKKSAQYKSAIAAKVKEMKDWVWGDSPTASYTQLVFDPKTQTRIDRDDSYGNGANQAEQRSVTSGIGSDGKVRLTVVNNVSVHDLWKDGMTEAAFKVLVDSRVKGDRVRVSLRSPDGSVRVLKSGVQSKDVTAVDVAITLKKGINVVFVDRTDAQGNVVGSSGALAGRGVEVVWDGTAK